MGVCVSVCDSQMYLVLSVACQFESQPDPTAFSRITALISLISDMLTMKNIFKLLF